MRLRGIVVRLFLLSTVVLVALPFVALPAAATCEVVSPAPSPDINYVTVCALDQGTTFNDGTQDAEHDYLLHVSHALEVDPVFDYAHVASDQGTWTYDDGTTHQERRWSDTGFGVWEGATGLVGTGAQADLAQRDQTVSEDGSGACSGIVGTSTCAGASGWFTVQDVASVGAGFYYTQAGTGSGCQESYELDLDAVVMFVPVTTGPQSCTVELPWIYDLVPPHPELA